MTTDTLAQAFATPRSFPIVEKFDAYTSFKACKEVCARKQSRRGFVLTTDGSVDLWAWRMCK